MVTFGDKVYAALFDPLPQAVIVLEGDSIEFANDAASRLLGDESLDCVGSPIGRYLDVGASGLSTLLGASMSPIALPSALVRTDGSRRDVDVEAEPLEIGSEQRIRLTLTESQRGRPELDGGEDRRKRTAESELRAIFRALPDHFLRLDPHGRILEYNAPEHAPPFVPPTEFIGRRLQEMLPIEYTEDVTDAIESAIDTGSTRTVEFAFPVHGTTHTFETRIVPYAADRLIAILRDVTERKRRDEQALLANKLESIERLAGGIAHDFNNLLTAIVAHAELAMLELPEDSAVAHNLKPILGASERAADLTRKLLAFSKSHVGDVSRVDVAEVVRHFSRVIRGALGEDIVLDLRVDPHSRDFCVLADPRLLEKALFNVVVNAREAMENGGRLTVALRHVTVGQVFAAKHFGLKRGEYCAIYLHDTGHGMDEATLKRAFDPFFTTRSNGEGRGLGLPTTHGIVKQLGGYVLASSRSGRGTLIAIYLPLASNSSIDDSNGKHHEVDSKARCVLVVEDELAVREVVSRALRNHGYQVATCENGCAAIEYVTKHGLEFDMLVTDVVMPQMGGRELAQRLRRDKPGLRVLYMSGYTASSLDAADLAEPGTGFLQKPFTPAVLADHVARLIAVT